MRLTRFRPLRFAGLVPGLLLLAAAGTGPVVLQAAPGTAEDASARQLAAHDIADSVSHGETPLVLVGSAPLATRRGAPVALFVQLQSAALCGSAGCDTSVYLPARGGAGWIRVLDSVSGPITVSRSVHGHMHDLVVGDHDRWTWAGHGYRDTVQAPALAGLKRSVEHHEAVVERHGGVSPPPPK